MNWLMENGLDEISAWPTGRFASMEDFGVIIREISYRSEKMRVVRRSSIIPISYLSRSNRAAHRLKIELLPLSLTT